MNNFSQRIFSTLVTVPLVVVAICWGVWSYFVLFLLLTVLAMLEFYRLVGLGGGAVPDRFWGVLSGVALYTLVFGQMQGLSAAVVLHWLGPVLALTFVRALYRKRSTAFADVAYTLLGVCYVGGPLTMLHLVAFEQGEYNCQMVLGIMLLLWADDVGAYLVGKSMGRRQLFARISPRKAWEGAVGGGVLTVVVGCVLEYGWAGGAHCWGLWLGMGGIVAVVGPYGDLVESMLKRSVCVKDSGTLMPGHGGVLDRLDSFLLAMPFLLAFVQLCKWLLVQGYGVD